MNRFVALMAFVASASLTAGAVQLIPAGSKLECMVSEKVSSKTMQVGDPVLCELNHSEVYGRSTVPYGAVMSGRFEEYKDPGHFVGKGWMELKFDKLIVGNDTVIPIATRVISTSQKNKVDSEGRIDGTGHPVRDTVEWLIPVLWPIDLINLPRRGPTPTLKPETRLTILVMEDIGIPTKNEVQRQPEPISKYNYADNQSEQQAEAPIQRQPLQNYEPAYTQPAYTQPSPTVVVVQQPAPVVIQQQPVVMRPPVVYAYPPPPPPPPPGAAAYYYPRYYRPY
jgi:hypothetical protein